VSQKKICLVVPTIRENSFKQFIQRWDALRLFDHVDLVVVEDNPKKTFSVPVPGAIHYCWDDIECGLGSYSWIIPRRSDTVRSWGYLCAYRHGYEYILTLDDDCYPPTKEDGLVYESGEVFVQEHLNALTGRTRWFNTLSSVKPRGVPFYGTGKLLSTVVNHGLWTNVLDYDAPTQLVAPVKEKFSFDNRIVPHGLYFPMCGMNVMWRREWTVCMYHLLMGQAQDCDDPGGLTKLPFDRFGDIWCGIIMKKIADTNGRTVGTGMPYIRHERASNPFTNLKKEANGLEVNETFWEYVDLCQLRAQASLPDQYKHMGAHIGMWNCPAEYADYFKKLGNAMQVWAKLFEGGR
jgi:hypothetical protein